MFPLHDDNPARGVPYATIAIIVLNLLALVWSYTLDDLTQQRVVLHRGFIPARIEQLQTHQPIDVNLRRYEQHKHLPVRYEINESERLEADTREIIASLFTAMFMHAGWVHFIGNMWFLLVFGNSIEARLGHTLFAGFYLLGGLIAAAVHWAQDTHSMVPVIGASGAVASVLGAYVVTFPHAKVRTLVILIIFVTIADIPAIVVLGVWFLGQLLNATQTVELGMNGGVAWWAHVGGFLGGMIVMYLLDAGPHEPHDGTGETDRQRELDLRQDDPSLVP
ncbi:MAG: rhomboid family intramembrane serine protease [Pirellulales bacterium]|nr:rhomboid family intramembrane serine protease [Pirellulales bacterium]